MTVMVTGASGMVGRALIPALRGRDEVRATVRRPDAAPALRALGAKVAVTSCDDADALAEILPRVVTLIHLIGGPHQPDEAALADANLGSVERAVEAARRAGVPRFVLVSVPGASPDAPDPFLRAKGRAERAVIDSGLEHAIVRCTHVYGVGGLWFTAVVSGAAADPPVAIGGEAPVAPVHADDVAAVLAAAEGRPGEIAGTWALEGPDALSPAALAVRLGAGAADLGHVDDAAGLEDLLAIALLPAAARHVLAPARADAPDAASAFGVVPTGLDEGLRRTIASAAAG